MGLNPELLEVLACPRCRGEVLENEQARELVCEACAVAYEIRDGIPVMLPDAARSLSPESGA
ncbi:hypothetical protein LZ24_01722 [Desulfobotulus alkaliphilus]|uniref:UPF0434 protein LZ24_01722 n=1 Tax=Desulfobotulus alkaliphilus TaxID=622671 RepID=A0A562RUT3_9BACT|nr:Trm112 family protein [Desulfobotulus alkaliphilus]TWI72314.1 hypothetical protein LZ24_01722 [Desulfobotulus alkaliphilus]